MENILKELYSKLNSDHDMDGYGNGYEAAIREAILIVEKYQILHENN